MWSQGGNVFWTEKSHEADKADHALEKVFEDAEEERSYGVAKEARALEEGNYLAQDAYRQFSSPWEEGCQLLRDAQRFLQEFMSATHIPWHAPIKSATHHATLNAIHALGITLNGSKQLPWYRYLQFGSVEKKLENKLTRVRKTEREIAEQMESLGDSKTMRDGALEHFSPLKRFVVEQQFFSFCTTPVEKVNPLLWLLGWMFLIGVLMFCLFYTLVWGMRTGGWVFSAWGLNFMIGVIEDVFALQLFKILVIHVVALYGVKPQLKCIYRVLNKLAISYAQEEDCLLTQQNLRGFQVCHYLCPTYRLTRHPSYASLTAGKILMLLKDLDVEVCRMDRNTWLKLPVVLMVALPVFFQIYFSVAIVGEFLIDGALPMLLSALILANFLLFTWSIPYFAVVYVVICVAAVIFYRWPSLRQSVSDAVRKLKTKHMSQLSVISSKRAFPTFKQKLRDGVRNCFLYFRRSSGSGSRNDCDKAAMVWQHMNLPAALQGAVNTSKHSPLPPPDIFQLNSEGYGETESSSSGSSSSACSNNDVTLHGIPLYNTAMIFEGEATTGVAPRIMSFYRSLHRNEEVRVLIRDHLPAEIRQLSRFHTVAQASERGVSYVAQLLLNRAAFGAVSTSENRKSPVAAIQPSATTGQAVVVKDPLEHLLEQAFLHPFADGSTENTAPFAAQSTDIQAFLKRISAAPIESQSLTLCEAISVLRTVLTLLRTVACKKRTSRSNSSSNSCASDGSSDCKCVVFSVAEEQEIVEVFMACVLESKLSENSGEGMMVVAQWEPTIEREALSEWVLKGVPRFQKMKTEQNQQYMMTEPVVWRAVK